MARKNRPPDHESVIELTKRYADVESKLRTIIFEPKTLSLPEHKKQIGAATKAAEEVLRKANKQYADTLAGAFKAGGKRAHDRAKTAQEGAQGYGSEWERTSSSGGNTRGKNAFKAVRRGAFIDLQNGMTGALAGLRKTVADTVRELGKSGRQSIGAFTQAIEGKLKEGGLLEVRYENGAHIRLDRYAKMLARSSRIETENLGMFAEAQRLGTNLVKCIGQSPTCELCGIYRNRIFSISGKDKRFPALYDGQNAPLREGYHVIHPNCRCEFIPWFEEIEGPEETKKAIEFSNRPFEDNRTKKERDEYAAWQAGNRQLLTEQAEYDSMKALLGEDMPYKSLGGFRKARRDYNDAVKAGQLDKNVAASYNNYAKTKRAYDDKKLQARIRAEQPKTIEEGKQGKHIRGHNNYQEGKSYLAISIEEAQALVDTYAGSGELQRTDSGKWNHKERIVTDKIIGVCIDKDGKEMPTKKCYIHYSKTGTHIVPTLKGDGND